jgi:hypothetical protein
MMTVQAQVFIPRNYDIFAELDVDKKEPAMVPTAPGQRVRTNRLDARNRFEDAGREKFSTTAIFEVNETS